MTGPHTHECSNCLSYATRRNGEIDHAARYFGRPQEITAHAFIHPIGDPRDYAIRIEPADQPAPTPTAN
ncbi:hypothetical protein OG563_26670 [Nocardia vinacea]|uniref:Uncharacterized protein n=1 Tax=Nocardia vinacea TaxID=96468 RepID=A0ABZ1YLH1_9NOCA|nr:hypothetical protein [Nocardia vinacea]